MNRVMQEKYVYASVLLSCNTFFCYYYLVWTLSENCQTAANKHHLTHELSKGKKIFVLTSRYHIINKPFNIIVIIIIFWQMGFQFAGKAIYSAVWVAAVSLFMELLGFSTQKWLTAGGLGTVLLTLAGREV